MIAPLRRLIALALLPLLPLEAMGGAAQAQAAPAAALPGDPPARVGRLSHIEGQVSARTPEQTDWAAAVLNYPVSTGLALWTEPKARAEVTYGDGAFRLDGETAVSVTRLDDAAVDLRVDQGAVHVSVRQLAPASRVSVETPAGRMEALAPGTYRVDSGTGDQPAGVTVIDGKARFGDGNRWMEAIGGEAAFATSDATLAKGAARPGAFDEWAMAREQADRAAAASVARYVPQQMTGYEDLNRHGTWQQTADYGTVWYPAAVPVEWAPYRHGHWAWVAPWGWTWIDDAPWGFAPFHYGRWVQHRGRWCWAPGYYHARPVYAPALVAFIGGSGFSIGVAIGRAPAIGWVPLGPREVYRPPYRSSVTYVRNINITHVDRVVINNINTTSIRNGPPERDASRFTNRGAATVMPVDAMRRAEPVRLAGRRADDDVLQSARPTTNLTPVEPTRAARAGFETEHNAAPRDRQGGDRQGNDRPASRELGPGRPMTADPDRLPAAPAPRRDARATPDRNGPDRSGPDRATPDRGAPQPRGATVAPSGTEPPLRATPAPGTAAPVRPEGRTEPRGAERQAPAVRTAPAAPAAPTAPRRPDEQRGPDNRSDTTPRPESRSAGSSANDSRNAPATNRVEPQRSESPRRIEQPRPEQPRAEQRRVEQPRLEQPRIEQPRLEQPRMERRIEQPRVETPRQEAPRAAPQRQDVRPDPRPEPQRGPPPKRDDQDQKGNGR